MSWNGLSAARASGWLAIAAVAMFAAVGCGGSDDAASTATASSTGASTAAGPTTVTVGVLPLAAVAPVYLGVEHGFFKEEGLEVKTQVAQGGAAIVPGVQSGDIQFAYSNNVSPLLALSQGIDLRVVAEGNQERPDVEHATEGIVVADDSPIRTPDQLAGKTIAVNTLQNIGTVALKAALEARGVDPEGPKLIEIPFPDMISAIERGRVDAAELVEPFLGQAKAAGMRVIMNPFAETAKELDEPLSIASYFTSQDYLAKNPDTVAAFVRALNRSLDYAAENPDEVRQAVQDYAKLPAAAANNMELPFFTSTLSQATFPFLAERMARYGMVQDAPSADELLSGVPQQ